MHTSDRQIPFFLEDQSGQNIYAVKDLIGFWVKETDEDKNKIGIYMREGDFVINLGTYDTESAAKKELDHLIDSMTNGESRYSLCMERVLNWRRIR